MKNKVHIYGPQFSNFVRNVQLVCEEKSIEYSLGFEVDGKLVEPREAQHGLWHPYKKVPILIHGDVILGETASICRYLDNNFSGLKLQPESASELSQVDKWCQIITIYIDKAIIRDYLLEFVFPKGEDGQMRLDIISENKPEFLRALSVVEAQLGGKDYLVGNNYSLADIMLVPILYYVHSMFKHEGLLVDDSSLGRYLQRIKSRKATKHVLVPKE